MTTLTLLALSGCLVGKAKYEASLAEIADLEDQIADLQATHSAAKTALEQENDQLSKKVKTLEGALAEAKAESASLQEQMSRLQAEMAAAVKDKSKLKASVEEMQEALSDLSKRKAAADARAARYADLLSRFKSLIDAGKLQVKIVDGRMLVELATDVLFAKGSADLSPEGKTALTEVAAVLADIPDRAYQVAGHTDNDPIATTKYPSNWELGAARALVVTKTLVAGGLAPERVSAATYAEYRPATGNDTAEGKAANRRIEIVVVPNLSELPGYEELAE